MKNLFILIQKYYFYEILPLDVFDKALNILTISFTCQQNLT